VAVVRYRSRDLLVSYGEGGVRLLDGEEGSEREKSPDAESRSWRPGPALLTRPDRPGDEEGKGPFEPRWWNRIRSAAGMGRVGLVLLLAVLGTAGLPGGAEAEAPALEGRRLHAPFDLSARSSFEKGAVQEPVSAPSPTDQAMTDQEAEGQDGEGGPESSLSPETAVLGLARQLPEMDLSVGEGEDGLQVSGPVGTVLFLGFLTLLPTLLLLMTGFTRILVVMHLLKQALGTQTAPPTHLLTAMALLLTGFVMAPTLAEVNRRALTPWLDGKMDEVQMIRTASVPFRSFMLEATREEDLGTFLEMRGGPRPETVDDIPMVVVTSAFVISELRHAFQIGFALFLPFVVIDIVVASVLMSMGMFMLPPVMVSLPFKLLLFVLVDGWSLVVEGLVRSFA
jgi:flagellar biosynthetic protein FliP